MDALPTRPSARNAATRTSSLVLSSSPAMAAAVEASFEFVDTHHELEYNRMVRGEMEKLGGHVYKLFRIYRKFL